MKEYDFSPYNLPADVLAAIGLAITSAAQTESVIEMAIAGCAGVDAEYGLAITTQMNMPTKFSVLLSVAEIRIDDLDALDELDRLLAAVEKAFAVRNRIAHDRWCRDPTTGEIFTVKTTAKVRVDAELVPMSLDELKDAALAIYKSGMDLMLFINRHNLHAPVPEDARPRGHKSRGERKKRRERLQTSPKP